MTTRDRLIQVMHDLQREGKPVNVLSVSRLARLNRSGLYKNHREIVELIRRQAKKKQELTDNEQLAFRLHKTSQIAAGQKKTIEALTQLCLELHATLQRNIRQAGRSSKKAERQIVVLSNENADLRRELSKVTRLRTVPKT